MSIALATCRPLEEADEDEELLLEALRSAGLRAELVAWNDPEDDPAAFERVVLRSTWDYHLRPDAFRSWLGALPVPCWNPVPTVLANLEKRYLLELEADGLPIVPTLLREAGTEAPLGPALAARGWNDVVVKPEISAGSWRTQRFGPGMEAARDAFAAELGAERGVLVQPYLATIEQGGEAALVWIDGEFTHAVEKAPRFVGQEESVSPARALSEDELRFAERTLECWRARHPGPLLYARVDVIRGDDGELALSELELVEPSLFLVRWPPALERLVNALLASPTFR